MTDDFIDDEGFDCFFTENDMLRQHCRLLETELAELHGELRESRGKVATLVLMWSGVSRELAKTEAKLRDTKAALEVAVHEAQEREALTPEGQKEDQPLRVAFSLTYAELD
jgi:predicted  nucleic acid-binding Zn-ribbon protein